MKLTTENTRKSSNSSQLNQPFRPREIFRRAVDYFNGGRFKEAAGLFERIIKAEPKNSEAHYNLGLVRYYQELYAKAESCFRKAVGANPANVDAHFNLGRLLGQMNRPAEAAECYLEVLDIKPDDVEAHFNLGGVLKDLGLLDEAIDSFQQAVKHNPQYGPAYANMGVVFHIQGRKEEAIVAYRQASRLGNDSPSNRHILNALTGTQTDSPPDQYVANLFDGYALRFDESLVAMGYQTPMFLRQALDTLAGPEHFGRGLDLGCGTGFSGLPFREKIDHLTGVDLSARMLAVAEKKEIYDDLHQDDLVSFLAKTKEFYDLFLMADVCVYLGKLDAVFQAIRQRSKPGALLLFSVELGEAADFYLRSSGRYAHSRGYIERLATTNNMVVEYQKVTGVRKDKGRWIDGVLSILKRV